MWHVARYRGCMECLVALLVLQIELAMAFLHMPRTRGSMRQPNVAPCKMTPNPTENSKPTTRKGVMQELSAVAGVIAASGAVLVNNPPEAIAELSVTPSVLTQEDRRGVEKTTIRWKDTVTSGAPDAPGKTAALYAPDGVLWGTVSEEVRDTPGEIYDYFDYFARLPKLQVSEYTPVSLRVYGDFATQAGTYTFAWQGGDGRTMEKRARFSFTFRRDPSSSTGWTIVEHHSSVMPTSPVQLKHAKNTES